MSATPDPNWPTATVDAVDQLTALARSLPGAGYASIDINVPFDDAWNLVGDIESGQPRFEPWSTHQALHRHDNDHITVVVDTPTGSHTLDGILRPGWCLMSNRQLLIGMAASTRGTQTRITHLEAWLGPFPTIARPLLHAKVRWELHRIRRLFTN